jgi:hypothetical protein
LAATCTKGVGSVPVAIYSLFAACDVRVNDLSWDKDEALKEEFTFFWNKSIVEHGAPNSWNPPLQIAVISDELWSKRLDDCVKKVAKECYVNLGNSDIDKFFRKAHSFWAGIPLELPSTVTARSAAGLLIIAVLSSSTIKLTEDFYVFDAIEPVAEVVEQETNGVHPRGHHRRRHHLGGIALHQEQAKQRDPEKKQVKKGNYCFLGLRPISASMP